MCHLVIDGDACKDGRVAFGVWLALLHNKENRECTFIHRCNSLCYVRFSCLLHSVANLLKTMQCTVAKHFIHCKHNITIPHTQVIPQKVVTFFENLKSWSHLSLFVWDWNCRARRIASDCARFYGVAKCVTAGIWQDSHPKTQHRTNIGQIIGAKRQAAPFKGRFGGVVYIYSRKKRRLLTFSFA